MKMFFVILIAFFTFPFAIGNEVHQCTFRDFNLILRADSKQFLTVEILKGKTKISSCQLRVVFSEDGKSSASQNNLKRFEKIQCTSIYDIESRKIDIIDKGFVKFGDRSTQSYIYIVRNEQPLLCKLKP